MKNYDRESGIGDIFRAGQQRWRNAITPGSSDSEDPGFEKQDDTELLIYLSTHPSTPERELQAERYSREYREQLTKQPG